MRPVDGSRPVTGPGRWIWGVSGVVTAVALMVPGVVFLRHARIATGAYPLRTERATQVISQPVTSLTVDTDGSSVQVHAAEVSKVSITESIAYRTPAALPKGYWDPPSPQEPQKPQKPQIAALGPGPPPMPAVPPKPSTVSSVSSVWPVSSGSAASADSSASSFVTESLSGGRLALGVAPSCQPPDCGVVFDVTVPSDVSATLTSEGGPVIVSGVRGATVVSDGGLVSAGQIGGELTVSSGGGTVLADGVTGPLNADSGSGTVDAEDLTGAAATVTTEGGPAQVIFDAAPQVVSIRTGGGAARVDVPGAPHAPYAVSADSGGGPLSIGIPTTPAARRSIAVSTDGGPLLLQP